MLYIQGYGYVNSDQQEVFVMVAPGSGVPYVTSYERGALYRLCRHHSHHYRLDEDFKTATLVQRGDIDTRFRTHAPETVNLTPEQTAKIVQVVAHGQLYDSLDRP